MRRNPLRTSFRSVTLRYFPLIAVLLLDVVFLAMLDSSFVYKKRALIVDSRLHFNELLDAIEPLRSRIINMKSEYIPNADQVGLEHYQKYKAQYQQYYEQATTYLQENAPKILQGNHPWFRVVLADETGEIIYDYQIKEKLKTFNDWSNCLFFHTFSAPVGSTAVDFRVYYTTPKGWPEIEALVRQYWLYAIAFVLATTILYFWLHFRVFKPLERVGRAIENTIHSQQVAVLPNPAHDIEDAFNQMARNQREILFGLKVDQIIDTLHSLPDDQQVLEQFLLRIKPAIPSVYPLKKVCPYLYDSANQLFTPLQKDEATPFKPHDPPYAQDGRRGLIILHSGSHPQAALHCETGETLSAEELGRMVEEIRRQAESGLARGLTRSRALTEERNRFGINLATNMGHDLTNIIASGKWDLDTIQRAQGLGIIQLDPQKGEFFNEALEGLDHNLEFLQEMVDIYRSVAYFRHPNYELTELSALLQKTSELFRRSTSQNLSITVQAPQPVEMTIEPRLFRMAIFNILSNSCQAIQNHEPRIARGEIIIELKWQDHQWLTIAVADNGPGMRSPDGNLLRGSDLNRIFQSGYTTKDEGSGGGLGLAWVKSIVEDYHAGYMQAENRPEGGAKISIIMPIRAEIADAPTENDYQNPFQRLPEGRGL